MKRRQTRLYALYGARQPHNTHIWQIWLQCLYACGDRPLGTVAFFLEGSERASQQ